MSTISFDISDLPDWADKQPGDTCEANVTVKVTANDGKTLEGEVTDAEACDTEEDYSESEDDGKNMGTSRNEDMNMEMGHKPAAIIAIGIKPMSPK